MSLGCDGSASTPVRILAASSLTEALDEARKASGAGATKVSYAGSQALRTQIAHGAPADLFITAHRQHLEALGDRVQRRGVLGTTELVLVTPIENPAGLERFEDLPQASRIVLGAKDAPIGTYTEGLLLLADKAQPGFRQKVLDRVRSRESNVRLVRSKVTLGAGDAAVVYRTETIGRDDVHVVEIPKTLQPTIRYHWAVLKQPRNDAAELALDATLQHLLGETAASVWARHGVHRPPAP